MKKTLILTFTTFLMVFGIILTSIKVKADTQEITPFYSGDILNGKDLYLFQDLEPTPNFENGYLNKKTISSTDIYYSGESNYNGWYKDLGMDLIDEITAPEYAPENPYFALYVTFNDMLGQYFQLATRITGPFLTEFYIKFRDESPLSLLDVDESGGYLLLTENTQATKQIEWFAWKVYYPDYMPSFRPLTADLAYQFGLESGYYTGRDDGYNIGYRFGHESGYRDGLNDARESGYYSIFNFNQLVRNGNFINDGIWVTTTNITSFTTNNNQANIICSGAIDNTYLKQSIHFENGHKYLMMFESKLEDAVLGAYAFFRVGTYSSTYFSDDSISTNYKKFIKLFTFNESTGDFQTSFGLRNSQSNAMTYLLKNVMIIDLTQMFGQGHEPDLNQAEQLLPSSYYEYTTSELISLNYLDGYNVGLSEGYVNGSNAQATKQLTSTGWIQSIFGGISSLLNIQIFPGVTIGLIVGIPFIITLAYFVIRAFRGGGGA